MPSYVTIAMKLSPLVALVPYTGTPLRRGRTLSVEDVAMRKPDDKVVIFSDGRPALTRRDLTHDNEVTCRREFYNVDRTEVTSWMSMEMICQKSTLALEPWGTYARS